MFKYCHARYPNVVRDACWRTNSWIGITEDLTWHIGAALYTAGRIGHSVHTRKIPIIYCATWKRTPFLSKLI
jgi:hypothetical protein